MILEELQPCHHRVQFFNVVCDCEQPGGISCRVLNECATPAPRLVIEYDWVTGIGEQLEWQNIIMREGLQSKVSHTAHRRSTALAAGQRAAVTHSAQQHRRYRSTMQRHNWPHVEMRE